MPHSKSLVNICKSTSDLQAALAAPASSCQVLGGSFPETQGFTPAAIQKLSAELKEYEAVARVFSTTYRKTCGQSFKEIYERLSSHKVTIAKFMRGNTADADHVPLWRRVFGAILDDRPGLEEAKVEVEIDNCHHKLCCECAKAICCLEVYCSPGKRL